MHVGAREGQEGERSVEGERGSMGQRVAKGGDGDSAGATHDGDSCTAAVGELGDRLDRVSAGGHLDDNGFHAIVVVHLVDHQGWFGLVLRARWPATWLLR